MVTMDIYGHLFPSEQEKLAQALDEAFAQSQTDKDGQRRTELDLFEVGPRGIEPRTFGLNGHPRIHWCPPVSSCEVEQGNSGPRSDCSCPSASSSVLPCVCTLVCTSSKGEAHIMPVMCGWV